MPRAMIRSMPPKKCDDCGWMRRIGRKGIGWHWILQHSAKAAVNRSEFEDRRGQCEHCGKDFAHIHDHIAAVHLRLRPPAPRDSRCDHCGKVTHKYLLWLHYIRAHTPRGLIRSTPLDTLSPKPQSKSVVCDVCSKSIVSLYDHWRTSHSAKITKKIVRPNKECDDCGAQLRNMANLRKHLLGHRQSLGKAMQRRPQRFRQNCEDCGKAINGPRELMWSHWVRAHLPTSSAPAQHLTKNKARSLQRNALFCDQCGKHAVRECAFRHWLIQHSGRAELAVPRRLQQNNFACEGCGELFNNKNTLYRHFDKAHGTTLLC